MIGTSKDVQRVLETYPPAEVENWFSPRAHLGEIRVKYARNADGTDRTAWLPSSRHMVYVAKGWTCVEIDEWSIPQSLRV